jgi:acetolactate synthase II small subunit
MKTKQHWTINCNHTPETIDRILLPIRKRGLCVTKLNYETISETIANCEIEFDIDALDAERVYKNLIRIQDINEVTRR